MAEKLRRIIDELYASISDFKDLKKEVHAYNYDTINKIVDKRLEFIGELETLWYGMLIDEIKNNINVSVFPSTPSEADYDE